MTSFKHIFWLIFAAVLLTGCAPHNYFLVNSDSIVKYNRFTGQFELVWHLHISKSMQGRDSLASDTIVIPLGNGMGLP